MKSIGAYIDQYRIVALQAETPAYILYIVEHTFEKAEPQVLKSWTARYQAQTSYTTFSGQARQLMQLKHPAIVPIYDYGIDDEDHPYLVLPYEMLQLQTLQQRLEYDEIEPITEALSRKILMQVGTALVIAHQHDIVHGALSPHTVLLTREHEVQVLFEPPITHTLTQQEALDPFYQPPETENTRLSDQYTLAGLAGELLIDYRTSPSVAPSTDRTIARAQSPEPYRRFRTVRGFLQQLGISLSVSQDQMEEEPLSWSFSPRTSLRSRHASWSRLSENKRAQWAALLAAILLLVGGITWNVSSGHQQLLFEQATATSTNQTVVAARKTIQAVNQATSTVAHLTATASVLALASSNPDPSFKTLAYHSAMTSDTGEWDVGSPLIGVGDCSFLADGFHVTTPPITTNDDIVFIPKCELHQSFSDFSFVAHLKISQGGCGVLTFEDPSSSGLSYEVDVCQDGNYSIVGDPSNTVGDVSKAIKQGYDQTNTVGVVIRGSTFTLYINNQRIVSVPVEILKSSFHNIKARCSSCRIGLSTTAGRKPSDIVYSDVTIWTR